MTNAPDSFYPIGLTQLPAHWETAFLSTLATEVQPGFASGNHNREGRGVPHLRMANVTRDGNLDLSRLEYVPNPNSTRILKDEILFTNTNSAELVGKTTVFDKNGDWALSNHMTRIRLHACLDSRFFARQLHYLWTTGYFRHRCTRHVNQASFGTEALRNTVPLVVPPFSEQRRIVEAIETRFARLDAAVRALERARANLKRYRASVLIEGSEGRLFGDTPESSLQSDEVGGPRIGSAPPVLPSSWSWSKVGAVGEVQLGRQRAPEHHHGNNMHPYLRVANVFEDRIDLSDVKEMNFSPIEFETYSLQVGDILLNEGQTPELVGRPAMVRTELPGYCFQNTLVRFRAKDSVLPAFALVVFRAYLHKLRFQRIAQITTNIAHLGAQRFSEVEFPLPPLSEQRVIAQEVERRLSIVDEVSDDVDQNLARCVSVRTSTLTSAFEGRLVPQDPNDEPASALLERIKRDVQRVSVPVLRGHRVLAAK